MDNDVSYDLGDFLLKQAQQGFPPEDEVSLDGAGEFTPHVNLRAMESICRRLHEASQIKVFEECPASDPTVTSIAMAMEMHKAAGRPKEDYGFELHPSHFTPEQWEKVHKSIQELKRLIQARKEQQKQ